MSPCRIEVRTNKDGSKSYRVLYRLGGRAYRKQWAGSFRTLKEAKVRRDWVAGLIAAGKDPAVELARQRRGDTRRTLHHWFQAFISSRIDVSASTIHTYENARARVLPLLGDRMPETLVAADIQEWIAGCADLAPATVGQYLGVLRQVLDFAEIEPNPARSKKVRLPKSKVEEVQPPTSSEWQLIYAQVRRKYRLVMRLMECCALRIGEAVNLTYGDVDFTTGRIRVSKGRTKSSAGQRWLPVPAELMDRIGGLVPLEDRHRDRRVFQDLTVAGVRAALTAACRYAGVAHYSPHDLRHRRISLWLAHGFDVIQVKTWAGHSKASMSTDVYGHVQVEPDRDEWKDHWISAYVSQRRGFLGLEEAVRAARPEPTEEGERDGA